MKIVGIGLNRTGTTTLGVCLKYWGYRHISCSKVDFQLWAAGNLDELLRRVSVYDSFEDWPWPLIYQEIDRSFSGSKFILTRRRSPEVWFSSLSKLAEKTGPTEFRKAIYGHAMPSDNKDAHIEVYCRHLESVRDYFRNRPQDLLEVCWEEGSGWKDLADFLGKPCPSIPLPHANKSDGSILDKLKELRMRYRVGRRD